MARVVDIACALAGAVAVIAVSQAFEIHDWLTRRDHAAEFARFQEEQHARLWNTHPDL